MCQVVLLVPTVIFGGKFETGNEGVPLPVPVKSVYMNPFTLRLGLKNNSALACDLVTSNGL